MLAIYLLTCNLFYFFIPLLLFKWKENSEGFLGVTFVLNNDENLCAVNISSRVHVGGVTSICLKLTVQ